MTPFQWLTLSILTGLLAAEAYRLSKPAANWRLIALRSLVWLAAAAAIYDPSRIALISKPLGIGRAADLVMYVFVLAFLGTTFYFYARNVRLERQVTELARILALQHPRRGSGRDDEAAVGERPKE